MDPATAGHVLTAVQLPGPIASVIVQLDFLSVDPRSVAGGGVGGDCLRVLGRSAIGVGAEGRVVGGEEGAVDVARGRGARPRSSG